jgi:hypothetical protein
MSYRGTVYGNQVIYEIVIAGSRPGSLDFAHIRAAAGIYVDEASKSETGVMPAFQFAEIVMATRPEWVGNGQ